MRLIIIILTLLTLTACNEESRKHNTTNQEFQRYVDQFKLDHETVLGSSVSFDVPINFESLTKSNTTAECRTYPNGTKEIYVSKTAWESLDAYDRMGMIYHELGHCVLGRDHDNEYINLKKASIMNENIWLTIGPSEENNQKYIYELFTSDKTIWSL